MKTLRDACQLEQNALSIKLSDQIEQLAELINAEGGGKAFFEKTHITQGMQGLISEGIARLAGTSPHPKPYLVARLEDLRPEEASAGRDVEEPADWLAPVPPRPAPHSLFTEVPHDNGN